jgi:F-type H+-transporting ATPase subunit epsilon
MNHANKQLQCIVVTPEQSVLDEQADFVAVPLFDGELGVLPGRAPMICRLGAGELRLKQGANVKRLFVDGGFVQVRADAVTLLTAKAVRAENLNAAAAEAELQAALTKTATNSADQDQIRKAQTSARAKLRLAHKT